jgi:hypothetical protein
MQAIAPMAQKRTPLPLYYSVLFSAVEEEDGKGLWQIVWNMVD